MVSFADLSTAAGLKALNDHLVTRSYIAGYIPSLLLSLKHSQTAHIRWFLTPSLGYVCIKKSDVLIQVPGIQ